MNYELAQELKEAGFPIVTRWEVENNYRRHITATGEESLPPLGALLSEITAMLWKGEISMLNGTTKIAWMADTGVHADFKEVAYANSEANKKSGHASKTYIRGFIDDSLLGVQIGSTPEEAVARLWLALNKK